MPIRPEALAFASGLSAALVSSICALFLVIAPSTATTLIGLAIHQDLSGLTPQVTWSSFLTGLLFWGLGVGLTVWFAGRLYSRIVTRAQSRG